MKKALFSLFLLSMSTSVFGQGGTVAEAEKFVNLLMNNQLDSTLTMFDESVKDKITKPLLFQLGGQLRFQMGIFKGIEQTKEVVKGRLFDVSCAFERGGLEIRCPFATSGKLTGIFLPNQPRMNTTYKDAPYVNPEAIAEQNVTVESGKYKLAGVFTFPKNTEKFPVLVLVHGSGPQDKDESIGPNRVFRDLAKGLASMGVASLRYDKRTHSYKDPEMAKNLTVTEEVTLDAAQAIALTSTLKGVDSEKVFVLGHSLGGLLTPKMLAENPTVTGGIMLAANARPLEDVVLEQLEFLAMQDSTMSQQETEQIAAYKEQMKVLKKKLRPDTPAENLPLSLTAAYWYSIKSYDQLKTARKLTQPLLILQGENDYQVTMTDFELWKKTLAKKKNATFQSFKGLSHLFGQGRGPADYQQKHFVAPEVVETIANWVKKQ